MARTLDIIGALEVLAGEGFDVSDLAEASGLVVSGGDDDDDVAQMLAAAGYGFPDIIGALHKKKKTTLGKSKLMQKASLAKALGGHIFDQRGPTRSREFPLGFVSNGQIAPAGSQSIVNRPQVPFRVDRLVVPSDIAGSFTIDDLKVGKDSQFAASGSVPARVFAENGVGVSLKGDTAAISQDVVIATTNIGGGALTFRAAVIGPAVE